MTATTPHPGFEALVRSGKLATIGELAPGLVHELNNPLFAVLGLVELALRDVEQGTKLHERLRLVHDTALGMKETVRVLLEFVRDADDERRELALDELVRGSVALVERASAKRAVETVTSLDGDLRVEGRPAQLRQVLVALLVSARRAVPDGGRVAVRGERAGDEVRVTVSPVTGDDLPAAARAIAEAHGGALVAVEGAATLSLPAGAGR